MWFSFQGCVCSTQSWNMRGQLASCVLHTGDSPHSVFWSVLQPITCAAICQGPLAGPRGCKVKGSWHKLEAHAASCALSDKAPGLWLRSLLSSADINETLIGELISLWVKSNQIPDLTPMLFYVPHSILLSVKCPCWWSNFLLPSGDRHISSTTFSRNTSPSPSPSLFPWQAQDLDTSYLFCPECSSHSEWEFIWASDVLYGTDRKKIWFD